MSDADTIENIRQGLNVWGDGDAWRAHDLLVEASFFIQRSEWRQRVAAMLDSMGMEECKREDLYPGAYAWSESGCTNRWLNLTVCPMDRSQRNIVGHGLRDVLDGYTCNDAEPGGVGWHDDPPYSKYGNVYLRNAPTESI